VETIETLVKTSIWSECQFSIFTKDSF